MYPQHHPGSLTLGLGGIFIFFGIKSFPGSQAENKQIETEKTPQLFGFFFRLKSHFQPQEKQENGCLLYFFLPFLVINMIYFNFSRDISVIPVEGERCFPCTIGCCSSGLTLCRNKAFLHFKLIISHNNFHLEQNVIPQNFNYSNYLNCFYLQNFSPLYFKP